jgi:hypothetical protein
MSIAAPYDTSRPMGAPDQLDSLRAAGDCRFGFLAREGATMSDVFLAVGVGILTFIFGYIGMLLQRILPESHMTSGSRDMIGAVMGLITLLLALVLGTLVGSAYGFFAVEKANIENLGARAIQLDMALEQYGPETASIRAGLKGAIEGAYSAIWGAGDADPSQLQVAKYLAGFKLLNRAVSDLAPKTPAQQGLVGTISAHAGVIEQTRLLMSLQLASPISWPLLGVVVSWAALLFCGFGVLSKLNSTSLVALFVGAFSVASAVFLILELNQPFSGLFRIPSASVVQTIESMGG